MPHQLDSARRPHRIKGMKPSSLLLLFIIAVAIAVAIYSKKPLPPNNVAYSYACADGSTFQLITADDLSAIRLSPNGTATFSDAVLLAQSGASARYRGGNLSFVGSGETVALTFSGSTLRCQPQLVPGQAPLNWGDAKAGSGEQIDAFQAAPLSNE